MGSTVDDRGTQRTLALRSAGTRWTVEPTPAIPGASAAVLGWVSCTSSSDCTAVGDYIAVVSTSYTQLYVPLAEHWNGRSWSRERVPVPAGATSAALGIVSCPAAALCSAVGYYTDSSGTTLPLLELWHGGSWTIQTVPVPPGGSSPALSGVSCNSARACTAVGSYTDQTGNTVPLAETWNGTAWAAESPPNPAGSTYSFLDGVSCPSTTVCTAIGLNYSGAEPSFAERWQAGNWTIESTPDPSGGNSLFLSAVSCPTADRCAATGSYYDAAGNSLIAADLFSHGGWTAENVPAAAGANEYPLSGGVSCASAASCTATGGVQSLASGDFTTMADTWGGTTWTQATTPDPTGATRTWLSAVSCTGPSACTAVGGSSGDGLTLAEALRGSHWSIQPDAAVAGELTGVSCATARSCIAVGSNGSALAETRHGTRWTTMTVPEPAGATSASLTSVSCPTATFCTAVGSYSTSTASGQILAEVWNGTAWSVEPVPTPAGGGNLSSVSCSAPDACVAVGSQGAQTLAESWNGTAWTIVPTASPASYFNDLSSVSCASATACTAVGTAGASALAEAWDGSTWTVQPTPTPPGAIGGAAELRAVSCTSATACTAFGDDYNNPQSGTNFALAERWNGSTWTLQNAPTPHNVGFPGVGYPWPSYRYGLSCTAASTCVAVGEYTTTAALNVALALTER